MKKIVVSIVLSALFIQSPASAAVIKGSSKSCKVGSVKVDSNYKYACIQSGIWKKTSLPTKTPKPVPVVPVVTPVIPVTPSPAPIEVKPPVVQVPFSIDNLTPIEVFKKSRESLEAAIAKSSYELSGINFYIAPTIEKSKVDAELETLKRTAKLWANIYKPNNDVNILFYDYPSLEWAKSKVSSIHPNAALMSASSCSISYCGNATAGKLFNNAWLLEEGLGGGLRNRSTSAHEYTHLAQASIDHQYWTNAPLWLVEGMAQFYGEAIGYAPFDSNNRTLLESRRGTAYDYQVASGKSLKSILEKNDAASVREIMQTIEFPSPRYSNGGGSLSYVLGGYATEVLVAVYGHESFEKFVTSFGSSKDWELNFKNSFGISKDEFYGKITSYLAEVSKEL